MTFISNLISKITGKGLANIEADADDNGVLDAIDAAKSIDEIKAELSTQFESQISLLTSENEGLKNSLADADIKFNALKAENDTMIITASEAKTQIESLQNENSQLQKDKTELSGKLAGRIASNLTTNDEPPKYEASQTEKDWQARNAKLKAEARAENAKID